MWIGYGELCEGRERIVEARFSCCKHEHISLVSEMSVCNYVFHIHTPRACISDIFRRLS
ncbi:hypothetical protein DFJ73DRAFT_852541 [Zopfochytrium polystomum]|nr:hypothetical protein DFJ73DRAFT_852541 [Zopfochytrium polystomum]